MENMQSLVSAFLGLIFFFLLLYLFVLLVYIARVEISLLLSFLLGVTCHLICLYRYSNVVIKSSGFHVFAS